LSTGAQAARPFGFAKFLSWSSLVLILTSSLVVSIIIANSARKILLTKQQDFALVLARNLNHQIYRRFTLPMLITSGRIALRQQRQYERLDQVIDSTLEGLDLMEVRIYDMDKVISYSTDTDMVGRGDLADDSVALAVEKYEPSHKLLSKIKYVPAIFHFDLEDESVVLKTTYPLTVDKLLLKSADLADTDLPIMGILEIYQDLTNDYQSVVHFQWLIILTAFFTSFGLFLILHQIIRLADRVNTERLLEKEALERELHQNEKLASMGRTVAGIAHEIRNPLGIIRSSAELLLNRPGDKNEPTRRILKAIFDESKRLSQTVNDFLDYARPKQPKMEPVDLSRVLNQALVFLEGELKAKGIVVERLYPEGLMTRGDKDLLYRAFYNILMNSLQALNGQGVIRLSTAVTEQRVSLRFEDNGPGFESTILDKAVDPFVTTKSEGTGLGMAIVDTIVKAHKGSLEIANRTEGGASVTLSFPHPNP